MFIFSFLSGAYNNRLMGSKWGEVFSPSWAHLVHLHRLCGRRTGWLFIIITNLPEFKNNKKTKKKQSLTIEISLEWELFGWEILRKKKIIREKSSSFGHSFAKKFFMVKNYFGSNDFHGGTCQCFWGVFSKFGSSRTVPFWWAWSGRTKKFFFSEESPSPKEHFG